MREFLKENIVVVIAFSLPLLMIAGIAFVAYIPSKFVSTEYDFVYATCTDIPSPYHRCIDDLYSSYSIQDGKLVVNESDSINSPRIFLHDTTDNHSKEITVDEASSFKLNDLMTSPDGVTIARHDGGSHVFPFFQGTSSEGYYMERDGKRRKLDLVDSLAGYRMNDFNFIGWVVSND